MQDLQRQYRGRADFLTVYVKEAHPQDEWQTDSNEEEGVCYAQPVTLDDRVRIARDFVKSCEYEIPIVIDRVDNAAEELYAGWPERLYVVEADGTIAYKGKTGPFGYHPEEVAAWLMKRFPPRVLEPFDVGAARIASEPLTVRAIEYAGARDRWRLSIDASGRATSGSPREPKLLELGADRILALRTAIAEEGFFAWKEAFGEPIVDARTRTLAITVGNASKIVHAHSPGEEDGAPDSAHAAGHDPSPEAECFERLWVLLRGIDA